MISKVILPHNFEVDYTCDYLVGVDYGAFQLADQKIEMDVAIGDFDSVSEEQFKKIEKFAKKVIVLPEEKNETDSEAALMHLAQLQEYNDILMFADFGVRFDHLLNNFHLLSKYQFTLIDPYNKVYVLKKGRHIIENTHQYLSIFTLTEALITVSNVKYPLENCRFTLSDTYLTSNEINGDHGIIDVLEGQVIVVQSKDK